MWWRRRVLGLAGAVWLAAFPGALPARPAPIESAGYVKSDDGNRLYYQISGSGPVIIVPGRLFLYGKFRQLSDEFTVISYDMRNRGRSDPIREGSRLTIQDDVRDLETVRRHFGAARFIAVGYSYLGLMVVMYAMEHPDRVERIVQLGPVPLRFGTEYPANETAQGRASGADAADVAELERQQKLGNAKSHPKEFCELQWKVFRYQLVGNPANVGSLGASNCDMENEWPVNLERHFQFAFTSVQKLNIPPSDVARVRVPVLTIHGTMDRNAPYGSGREWARNLPNARLVTVRNGAHNAFQEYPEIVFRAVRTFVKGEWPANAERAIGR